MKRTTRIGVDIGGTFTDFVLHDESRGITRTGKRLTTPDDPGRAIVEGIRRLLDETGTEAEQIAQIVHGTTLITNTVLERTGAKVGLLATQGFRDVLEMGRESRYDTNDLFLTLVTPIVPRRLRLGIGGRVGADGVERDALDVRGVAEAVKQLVERDGIESLAIAFMHAYRNPVHELQALAVVRGLYPDLLVSLSSQVAPEIREFERTNTACVNAYVQPRVHGYLDRLERDLSVIGFRGDLFIMLSSGGITTVGDAKRFPVRLIESGPAAGAMAAAFTARRTGEDRLISFDVGGTTAKMCVIENGRPHLKHDFEAGRLQKFQAGSGLPLKVTVVDMIEIGSGGGSIAGIDALGLMKVGPRSAGSVPGPVCYNRGGTQPTVTDADLLLGYLDPAYFLGGEMPLSLDTVRDAMAEVLGRPLGLDATAAARGIQGIVDESMAAATRMHLAEKGKDPRHYTLYAFGGAGPVHAYGLAKRLKLKRILVPMGAGVISAFGFLVAAPMVDQVRGYVTALKHADWEHVNAIYREMEDGARTLLAGAGGADAPVDVQWLADMRYMGQGFEITVPLPAGPLGPQHLDALHEAFRRTYHERFDRTVKDVGIEVVNWRLQAALPEQSISLAHRPVDTAAHRGERTVYFAGHGDLRAAVVDRYALKPGECFRGPAVVEERESSCSLGPDCTISVDRHFNLVVDIDA